MGQKEMWLVAVALTALSFLISLAVFYTVLRLWTQARLLGIPVSLGQMYGMRLRGRPVRFLIASAIVAHKRGHEVSLAEVERAYVLDGKRQTREHEMAELVLQGRSAGV